MAFFAITNTISNPQTDEVFRADYALFGLEFYLSVSGLLILAGVIARDKGVGMLDLVLTKPANRWRLLIERLLPGLITYGIVCLLSVCLLYVTHPALPFMKAMLVSLITGIYLGLFGMTIANISRSALAGYGAGLIYWFLEAGFDGRFTAPFYLLIVSNQVDMGAGEVWRNPSIWLPVKLGMLMLSVWLFILNGWLLDSGPKKRHILVILGVSIPVIFIIGWWLIPKFI